MEDGTVSIFGLVFGVAASATNSQTVLLAGATGAISAAVSMMAGTYLDVSTERDRARAEIAKDRHEIERNPEQVAQAVRDRLLQAGLAPADADAALTIIQRTPGAMLKSETALDPQIGMSTDQDPWVQSTWMFVSNLFAAFVPVLPFAFLPLRSARALSLVVTTLLLVLLGIGRGIIGNKNVVVTALQTLAIAAAAAVAGLLMGSLITGRLSG
jgi:VIT1/CCC1 family predicted Fe2+/Mn2+ transporter